MSRIPVPAVHPYPNDRESTAEIAVESTYKNKKSLVSTGITPLEDEGSNILRVTTSVAGKPASQSHPPQVSAILSDESVPF
jgi:hypothetical protein